MTDVATDKHDDGHLDHGGTAVPDLLAVELNKISQRYLSAMAMILAVFYSIRGAAFLLTTKDVDPVALAIPAFAAALYGLVVSRQAKKLELSRPVVEVHFFIICLILIFNTGWAYIQGFNSEITPNMSFVLMAVGLGTISLWNWLAQGVLVVLAYASGKIAALTR